MSIELICRTCGRPFQPDRRDLMRGPHYYHYCSEFCRRAAQKRTDAPRAPKNSRLASGASR